MYIPVLYCAFRVTLYHYYHTRL